MKLETKRRLHIAGGCGEHGRNCFVVKGNNISFMVDCGVLAGEKCGYPRLSKAEILECQILLLTHSHGDHAGALKWLYESGFTGIVVAAKYTLEQLSWRPNEPRYLIELESICPEGIGECRGITIQWGRSGHCIGSVWYHINIEGKTLFFSGDYVEHTKLYECDLIRGQSADMAVLDCAYGHDEQHTAKEYCDILIRRVKETLDKGKPVLLPVPRYGRGLELLLQLRSAGVEADIRMDEHFERQLLVLMDTELWCRKNAVRSLNRFCSEEKLTLDSLQCKYGISSEQKIVGDGIRQVVFVSDPQLRSWSARTCANEVLAADGCIIMTGTIEPGSFSEQLWKAGKMELLRYPVHLDWNGFCSLLRENRFRRAIPYHSRELKCKEYYEF